MDQHQILFTKIHVQTLPINFFLLKKEHFFIHLISSYNYFYFF